MILGVGTDLCSSARIARLLERYGERFLSRVFVGGEIAEARRRGLGLRGVHYLASCFAAKECVGKALGTGVRRLGIGARNAAVYWRDIESGRLASGKPYLKLTGVARRLAVSRAEARGCVACVEVSTSDESGLTHVVVVLHGVVGEVGEGMLAV